MSADHFPAKTSKVFLWTVLSLIPLVNLYWWWKLIKVVRSHRESFGGYIHDYPESVLPYFILILCSFGLLFYSALLVVATIYTHYTNNLVWLVLFWMWLAGVTVQSPITFKASVLINCHSDEDSVLEHKRPPYKIYWFFAYLVGWFTVIPLLVWLWKASRLIAGHNLKHI